MKKDRKYTLGILALFLAALTWGSAFIFVKNGVEVFPPVWVLGVRFGLAGLLLNMICFWKWKKINRNILKHGIWMGIILYLEFYFFTVGIQYTTASRSSFIVASYVIFVPLCSWLIRKKPPERRDVVAAVVCLAGAAMILGDGTGSGGSKGDVLTFLCTIFYALHVVYGAVYAKEEDTLLLNMVQLGTAGVIAVLIAQAAAPFPQGVEISDLSGMVYLAVVSTIVPYLLCLFGQTYVRTTTSAVILSFESIFGCISSILILQEQVSVRFVTGAAIALFSLLISEGVLLFERKSP